MNVWPMRIVVSAISASRGGELTRLAAGGLTSRGRVLLEMIKGEGLGTRIENTSIAVVTEHPAETVGLEVRSELPGTRRATTSETCKLSLDSGPSAELSIRAPSLGVS